MSFEPAAGAAGHVPRRGTCLRKKVSGGKRCQEPFLEEKGVRNLFLTRVGKVV
jgi:hypothetical protein